MSLISITEAKNQLGLSTQSFLATCARFDIPIVRLNARVFRLRREDYELLLSRASEAA